MTRPDTPFAQSSQEGSEEAVALFLISNPCWPHRRIICKQDCCPFGTAAQRFFKRRFSEIGKKDMITVTMQENIPELRLPGLQTERSQKRQEKWIGRDSNKGILLLNFRMPRIKRSSLKFQRKQQQTATEINNST